MLDQVAVLFLWVAAFTLLLLACLVIVRVGLALGLLDRWIDS